MTALWVRHFVCNSIEIKFCIQEIIISTICGFIFPMDLFINSQILYFESLILITFQVYPSGKHPYEVFLNYGFIDVANPTSQHQESRVHSPTYGNPGVNFTNKFFCTKFSREAFLCLHFKFELLLAQMRSKKYCNNESLVQYCSVSVAKCNSQSVQK
jgi:hypothetical protein